MTRERKKGKGADDSLLSSQSSTDAVVTKVTLETLADSINVILST
jgi:hypothetical protein